MALPVVEAPTVARLDDHAIARQDLARAIVDHIDARGLNNTQAAAAAGIQRQDVIRLRRGEFERYSLGWLIKALGASAPNIRVRVVLEAMDATAKSP